MNASDIRLVLMPGLDGTGELFAPLRAQLPADLDVVVVRYPRDRHRSYNELRSSVLEACEGASSAVLFAESFSSPLAIEIAASSAANLCGLILCSGFAAPPIDGIAATVVRHIPAGSVRLPLPEWVIRRYLVGRSAPTALMQRVKETIASVPRQILHHRLNEVLTCSAVKSMARVKIPTVYIQASDDRLVTVAAFERIASANDRVIRQLVDGPHLLAQANPREVAAVILNFLRTLA